MLFSEETRPLKTSGKLLRVAPRRLLAAQNYGGALDGRGVDKDSRSQKGNKPQKWNSKFHLFSGPAPPAGRKQ